MIRSICGGLLALMCIPSALVAAPQRPNDDTAISPMHFAAYRDFPKQMCGPNCRVLISASGSITSDTPRDFEEFARRRDLRGGIVVLDSVGGSVSGAIALGRAIRALRLTTTVGRVRDARSDTAQNRVTVSPDGQCHSMCPFVLLSGVRRFVPPEAQVLVHDIWFGSRRGDATAASYSAEDLMTIQQDVAELVQYTVEMGGGTELLEIALRIPPWEPLRRLSSEELRRSKLKTREHDAPPASAPLGVSRATRTSNGGAAPTSGRGWTIAQRAGRPVLARRHLLTVEGQKIGTFELALSCGASNGAFAVTYAEANKGPDQRDPTSVAHVELLLEEQPVALDITPSRSTSRREFEMLASGTVPAGLVTSFARAADASIIVRTSSSARPDTTIRLGNSGFPHQFPQLAAACEMPQVSDNALAERASADSVH